MVSASGKSGELVGNIFKFFVNTLVTCKNAKTSSNSMGQGSGNSELKKHLWDHSFSTYAKFSEKLTFLTPWYAHVRVHIRG